jgi:phytoene dehydrogenase-like protein
LAGPLVRQWDALADAVLAPLVRSPHHPLVLARFGAPGTLPAAALARTFRTPEAQALLAGAAAHSCLPLSHPLTAGLGLVLLVAGHAVGWPVAAGGSQAIVDALASVVTGSGGEIVTGHPVARLHDLPPAPVKLLDVTPQQLLAMSGHELSGRAGRPYRRFRYGPGACKVDYVLSGPMPWLAKAARRAGTVHVGGTFVQVVATERELARGRVAERPFTLVAQPSVADPSRAPAGQHVLWAYCHVPNGCTADVSDRIEAQLDRFAPGWRDLVLAKQVRTAMAHQAENPNAVGGDISSGSLGGLQLMRRPRFGPDPYATPLPGVWLCSASTPPGPGAHGMAGWHAAGRALARS